MEIVEFLRARFADDEEQANRRFDEWRVRGGTLDLALTLGPARVLAECEAKRRIVELATGPIYRLAERVANEWGGGDDDDADKDLLRALALPYADHEDWREEWKP